MKKLVLFMVALLSAGALFAQTDCSDLFMSEYVEGWNNNKGLELYNPTSAPIVLDNLYRVVRWSNGSTLSSQDIQYVVNLTGTIDAYKVMVIIQDTIPAGQDTMVWPGLRKHATYLAPYAYGTTPPTPGGNCIFWNGDDAVSLQKLIGSTWTDIDIFGEIGIRPSNWQGPGNYSPSGAWTDTKPYITGTGIYLTKSKTLVRKHGIKHGVNLATMITYGNTSTGGVADSFYALLEYDSLPANFFDSLGHHSCDCRPAPQVLNLGPDQTVSASDKVTLDAGQFTTYLWSTGEQVRAIQVDSAGTGIGTRKVYCQVSDSYGVQSDTVRITFSPNAVLNLGPDQTVSVGDTVTLDAGQFTTYAWSTGDQGQIAKIDSSGVGFGTKKVYCEVTDIHGTQSDTVLITFKAHLGVVDHQPGMNVYIQPNPVTNKQFTVFASQAITSVDVISIVGKTVLSQSASSRQKEVKVVLNEIPDGLYLVRISYGNNQSMIKKIIVQ